MVREATSPMAKYTDEREYDPPPPRIFVRNGYPLNIWVSLQTPTRKTFTELIEQRGGKISLSETGADVRIGDHLKQSCAGMVSYRWIERCCRDEELLDTESYVIVNKRPAGGGSLGGGHRSVRRNEYSAEDDRILLAFVMKQKAAGGAIAGNRIYDSFAAAHPQHTSQSWRNRWVKVLANRAPTEEPISPPRRQSFGFTREQDEIILKVVKQPGAEPENPEFWERVALTVPPPKQWKERYFTRLKPALYKQTAPPSYMPKRPASPTEPERLKKPRSVAAPIPSLTPMQPFFDTDMTTPAEPPPRLSFPLEPPRSSSLPSNRRVTAPIPSSHHKSSSPQIPPENIIYQNPRRGTTIWRTPQPRHIDMDADDHLLQQDLAQESVGRTNRIRVSLGEINIEIESASSPVITQGPIQRRLASSPPEQVGRLGRRPGMGEIPSTPGSSPTQFKTESLREDPVIDEDPLIEEELVVEEDIDLRKPELNGLGIGAFGPDTQALFGGDDQEDELEIPHLEFASSPTRPQSSKPDALDQWVAKKAERYNAPEDLVWWTLERTSGRQKLAIKTLKLFRKHNVLPDLAGVWTAEEDDDLRKGNARRLAELDEKHGHGAAIRRDMFLQIWRRSAADNQREEIDED